MNHSQALGDPRLLFLMTLSGRHTAAQDPAVRQTSVWSGGVPSGPLP